MAKLTTVSTVFPWSAQIITQSKKSDNEVKQTMFHSENAGLLSAVFALRTYASPVVGS